MGAIHPLDSKKIAQNDIMTAVSEAIRAEFRKKPFLHHREESSEHRIRACPRCSTRGLRGHTEGSAAVDITTFSTGFGADQPGSQRPGSETKAGLKPTPQLLAGP